MRWVFYLSDMILPFTIFGVVLYGLLQKVEIYDAFVEGAKEGAYTAFKILPTVIGLLMAVGIFRASGALDMLSGLFKPLSKFFSFPSELIPLFLMRPISSMGSTGLILDLFQKYGPDSLSGRIASVVMGCTETVFYTISVYYLSVNIKKEKYTLKASLIANIAGMIASIYICFLLF